MANKSEALAPFFDMQCTANGDNLSTDLYLYLDQQFQLLNKRITPYGLNVPSFTAAEVAAFPATIPAGTIWLNVDVSAPEGRLQFKADDGTIKTIQVV